MLGWELPPHNSGGLGVACYSLSKNLADKGADIEFILPYSGSYDSDFMKIRSAYPIHFDDVIEHFAPYDSYKYETSNRNEQWVDIYGQQKSFEDAVAKLVEVLEFDVIHAHDWLTFRAALRAKEISGKPLILHVHSLESDRAGGKRGNPLVHEIEETVMLIADHIIAVSEKTKNQIISEYGIPADNIDVVYNSVDVTEIQFPDISKNAYQYLSKMRANGYKVVVNVGRMTVQKGLPNMMQAAKQVIIKEPKTLFLFVGDGEQFHELVDLSSSLGISKNIIFTGFQRGKKWRDAYIISNLFVMPSISEPFGLTPLEAAAYKTPSLISKQAGVVEIFKNCLKVDHWDIDEMANKIVSVIRNDSLANEISKNAAEEFKKLSWSKSADKIMEIYNQHVETAVV